MIYAAVIVLMWAVLPWWLASLGTMLLIVEVAEEKEMR